MKNALFVICITLVILMCACQPSGRPSKEIARSLVIEKWHDCTPDMCDELSVRVFEKDDAWFVEALFDGMKDDSVRSQKHMSEINLVDNKWQIGDEISKEFICQPGRGQEEFEEGLCN